MGVLTYVIGVVGVGAVGSLLIYFLNGAGVRPLAVQRTRCRRALCAGRCVELEFEEVEALPPSVKYTLVAVKAYDTAAALDRAAGIPVLFQNGLGGVEEARRRFGVAWPAVVTYGVSREGCRAELRGEGEIVLPREAGELADLLARGGARVRLAEDIEAVRWAKLAVNAAINPVTALLRAPNGVVAEVAWAREVALAAAREAAQVARALGVEIGDVEEEVLKVARATAANLSSMLQDVLAGRRTEVDYINGAVAEWGRRLGVPTPVNQVLHRLVKALEAAGRPAGRPAET